VLGIGIGKLTDKYGPRIFATANGITVGVGLLLMSQVNSVWQIYILYGIVIAIGMACFQIPTYSTIPRWFTKRRETALGVVQGGFGLGGMVLTPFAQWLITTYDWRPSYFIVGIVAFVIIIPIAQLMKHSPQRAGLMPYGEEDEAPDLEQPATPKTGGVPFAHAVRTSRFWLFGFSLFCFMFCLGVITTHIVAHATDTGLSATTAASMIALFSGSGILGKLSVGFISNKVGARPSLSIYLVAVTLCLVWLIFAKETWMLYVFVVTYGICYGGVITLPASVTAELFGLEYLSVIFASAMLIGTIGTAVGPVLAGSIFDLTGNYNIAFIICAILGILSVIFSLFLLHYRGKPDAFA